MFANLAMVINDVASQRRIHLEQMIQCFANGLCVDRDGRTFDVASELACEFDANQLVAPIV